MAEDCRIYYEEDPKMFRLYTNELGIGIGLLKIHIAASKAELHEITV